MEDSFGQSGPPETLMAAYHLDRAGIAAAVRRCLARK